MLKTGVVTALGAMSGTSLDGVDAAVLQTDGERIFGFGPSDYRAYANQERDVLRAALGRWPDDDVTQAARVVQDAHIDLLKGFDAVDLIGFHGQTLAHDPAKGRTHQCGDGRRLAKMLNCPVVWDFRSADMEAGGQGAPLAPFYHFALAKWIGATAPVAFLNLGGVGNITWVNPQADAPEDDGALLAFDTGPANAPINDVMQARRGEAFDGDGALAASGQVDASIVDAFTRHPYLNAVPPKSLDRDAFTDIVDLVVPLADADAVATLLQMAVAGVAAGVEQCPSPPEMLLVTGGGRLNQTMMAALVSQLHCEVKAVEEVGLDGDMLEAQAFAYLAVRAARKLPLSANGTTGVPNPVSGGQVSYPADKAV